MGDFYQTGVISTLHRFTSNNLDRMEAELKRFSRATPMALILPCLYSELEGPAMPRILEELKKVKYLRQIVIGLDRADADQFRKAREFFAGLALEKRIVWNDGPALTKLYDQLSANGISAGPPGKGRNVWMCFGYVLADEKAKAIALHDCDILTYSRELLARLCYPVVNPGLAYEYAKGYYARITDRFHGRVTRLFVSPLVRTLLKMVGYHPYLAFLDSFRYPLAGEFSLSVDLARNVRIPSDWGLEIGFLGEVFRNCATRRICEVEICDVYDHKHQALSPDDPTTGLSRMSLDITKSLLRTLAGEGVVISDAFIRSLRVSYLRSAQDTIKKYADDAALNGLVFDRHEEGTAVETFAKVIDQAVKEFLQDPLGTSLISNWSRVTAAFPDFLDRLKAAVEEDNK
jgi:glucosyl-3-phosphoglycerate synthase